MGKKVAVIGEIKWGASDGTELTLGFEMPFDVANGITCDIISWKDKWLFTPKEYEEYQDVAKSFREEQKTNEAKQ